MGPRTPRKMKLFRHENRLFINKEDSLKNRHAVIGIEVEYCFAPSTFLQREIGHQIKAVQKEPIKTFDELKEKVRSWLCYGVSELLEKECKIDGENHEWIFLPISHAAMLQSEEEIHEILSFITSLGYVETGPFLAIGIHHNIDLELLGADRTDQALTLNRILDFLFMIRHKLEHLSLRKYASTYLTDIDYMLGDKFYRSSEEYLSNRFRVEKDMLVQSLINEQWANMLGLILFPNDKSLIEFRFYGSTFRVSEFVGLYEFTMAMILYCKKDIPLSWGDFIAFCTNNNYRRVIELAVEKKVI